MQTVRRSFVDVLFTLALFCVFCASALAVVVIGADVYTSTARSMDDNFSTRTVISYLAEKVRQNDTAGAVALTELDGTPALVLTAAQDGTAYNTYVYYYDGAVRELLQRADASPLLSGGQAIAEVSGFTLEDLGGGLLRATVTGARGASEQLTFGARSANAQGGAA